MRKLKYHLASTLDGSISRRDGAYDFFPMEGTHVDDYLAELRSSYGAVLMGRRTYEPALRAGVTDPYPWLDTYVFSRTMKESPNPRVNLVSEDPMGLVRRLKEQDGNDLYLAGGSTLATTLLEAGLVDEVIVKLNPILLGEGVPLVRELGSAMRLDLLSTKVHANGVVVLRYAVVQ